jgi:plastocyanin
VKALRIFLFPLLILAAAALIACGDDDEADTGQPDETSPAATREDEEGVRIETPEATGHDTGGPTGAATGLDDEVQVQADDFRFNPETFSLPAGVLSKIEVRNVGAAPHTLTVYSDEEYSSAVPGADTGTIDAGEDASIETTFDAGQYFFRCEIHPTQMEGEFTAQ